MVPSILSEPQLYRFKFENNHFLNILHEYHRHLIDLICISLFEEILRWMRSDPELLWKALPQELSQLDLAQFEMHHWSSVTTKEQQDLSGSVKGSLGLLAFSLLLATIATQVFPTVPIENRLTELFEWFDKNDTIDYANIAEASAN
jgi:hypothetical protein